MGWWQQDVYLETSRPIRGLDEMSGSRREGERKERERQGVSSPHPLLGEEVGGVPVPPGWELKWRKEFVRGVVGPRAGQQGNGMRRLSSGEASVCGKWRERPFPGWRGWDGASAQGSLPWAPQPHSRLNRTSLRQGLRLCCDFSLGTGAQSRCLRSRVTPTQPGPRHWGG